MVKRDGAEVRRERIQTIARALHKSLEVHNPLVLSMTIKTFQYDYGLTEEKIMEYLEVLEGLNHFTIDRKRDQITKYSEPS